CTLSKHEAEAQGFDDALMHDYRGYVAEATGANVFFQDGKTLHTPTPDCFLNGITRQTVMQLAKDHGLEVIERHIKPEEIADFHGCFITGSAAEVTPVALIDEHEFVVSDEIRALLTAYDALVRA
ncbi:MAG TPA: branched-chain amino acid aminotransferase, partial [Alphaproteobacteria bacterium]|nr:branched-chain amino acid aminotransferase [Alphaproteobacteria bacterium]